MLPRFILFKNRGRSGKVRQLFIGHLEMPGNEPVYEVWAIVKYETEALEQIKHMNEAAIALDSQVPKSITR